MRARDDDENGGAAQPCTDAVSSLESAYAHLATKADLADLKGEVKSEIANLKADLIKWMVIAMAVWGGVLIGAIQFIP
jgi:hypothetical protein